MKTTKTAFIKKAMTAGMIVVIFIISAAFSTKEKKEINDKPSYCVVIGWEYTGKDSGGQPVISNVAYYNCRFYNSMHAENELNSYYSADYAKNRGTYGLGNMSCSRFETRDEAIRERRKLIEEYNDQWNPLLIDGFTITCD